MRRSRGWQSLPSKRISSHSVIATALVHGSCMLWLTFGNIVSARLTYLPQRHQESSLAFEGSLLRLHSALHGSARHSNTAKSRDASPLAGYRSNSLTGAKQKAYGRNSSLSKHCGASDQDCSSNSNRSSRNMQQQGSTGNTPRMGAETEGTGSSMPKAITRRRRTRSSKPRVVVSNDQSNAVKPAVGGLSPVVGAPSSYGGSVTRGQLLSTAGVLGLAAGVVLAGGGGNVKAANAVEVSMEA